MVKLNLSDALINELAAYDMAAQSFEVTVDRLCRAAAMFGGASNAKSVVVEIRRGGKQYIRQPEGAQPFVQRTAAMGVIHCAYNAAGRAGYFDLDFFDVPEGRRVAIKDLMQRVGQYHALSQMRSK